jgi:hypothetical protein
MAPLPDVCGGTEGELRFNCGGVDAFCDPFAGGCDGGVGTVVPVSACCVPVVVVTSGDDATHLLMKGGRKMARRMSAHAPASRAALLGV